MIYITLIIVLVSSYFITQFLRVEQIECPTYMVISNRGELITTGSHSHCLERINAQTASDKAFRIKGRAYKIRKFT